MYSLLFLKMLLVFQKTDLYTYTVGIRHLWQSEKRCRSPGICAHGQAEEEQLQV